MQQQQRGHQTLDHDRVSATVHAYGNTEVMTATPIAHNAWQWTHAQMPGGPPETPGTTRREDPRGDYGGRGSETTRVNHSTTRITTSQTAPPRSPPADVPMTICRSTRGQRHIRGTFKVASWNIIDGRKGMLSAARGLHQLNVDIAILTETKITDNRYPKVTSGYQVRCTQAASSHQGGVALLWRDNTPGYIVESVLTNWGPNIITCQIMTRDVRIFLVGAYLPPKSTTSAEQLKAACDACPPNCKLMISGDLNARLASPRNQREEHIAYVLDNEDMVDSSAQYIQRTQRRFPTRNRWTWSKKRGEGGRNFTSPDYFLTRSRDLHHIARTAFRTPRYHYSDHRAVVTDIWRG